MKIFIILILLLVNATLTLAQNTKLDSLYGVLKDYPNQDTSRAKILIDICYEEYSSNPEKCKLHAEELKRLSEKIDYNYGIGMALRYFAHYYWTIGSIEKSVGYAFEMLSAFEKHPNTDGLFKAYLMVGLVHEDWDFETAKKYYRKALDLSIQSKRDYYIGYSYNNLGTLCYNAKRVDEATDYHQRALEIRKQMGDQIGMGQSYVNLGICALSKKEYQKAIDYYTAGLPSTIQIGDKTRLGIIYEGLGTCHAALGEFKKANTFLQDALTLFIQLGNRSSQAYVYSSLLAMEQQRGNVKKALEYSLLANALKDSVFNKEKIKQVVEMETKYETEKKEHTIQLLEQEKRIQTIWQNALIGGVLLSLTATFLYLSRARKARQLLEVQQLLNEKLKEVDKLKSSFFANISHEFRTPLALILAPLEEELKRRPVSEMEPLQLMRRNANRLLELVNQLLDLSKLEAGKMELHVKQDNIQSFLKVVAASFDSWAQHKQIQFAKNIEVTEQLLWYDQDKVEKIITNLLANAFKFTPASGKVTLTVALQKKEAKDILSITVADTGKGIPPEDQEKVFSSFYQTKQTIDGHEGGTGLGLSLVKELVKLYGGIVTLQSTVGIGTIFLVELPTDREAFSDAQRVEAIQSIPSTPHTEFTKEEYTDEEVPEYEPTSNGKDSILIVEDNADLRNFMVSILAQQFTVFTANDGEEALELAVQILPNLILSDLMMPKMDGIQLAEKIKTDERTSHIPVILLTAKNEQQSRIEGLRTGADDYLTKPFSTEELLVRMINLIEQRKKLAERFRERILVPVTTTQEISLDDKFLQKVRQVIETNISDTSFTVEKLAEEVHLNRTQLLRKLKALTGLSPNDFIKDLRLKKAADMIQQKADTITQIGYAVGFNDQSYFTKCFKKQYGKTPSEFAEMNL